MHLYDKLIISNLNNSIKCYVKEARLDLNYVYFILVVKRGSLSDKKYFGEAHFVEHVLLEFDRQKLYKNKIEYNIKGTTSLDKTVFMLSCKNKKEDIEKLIVIIKNISVGKYLNKDSLEQVRKDIIDEYNREIFNNLSYSRMYEQLLKITKVADSIPIGNINDINKIKYEDIVNYFNENYTTENMAVLSLGNFNSEIMVKKIKEVFSKDLTIENLELITENYKKNTDESFMFNKTIISNVTSIHIFVLNATDNRNVVKSALMESITITLIEEILNTVLGKIVYDIKIEINQFSYENRFIHIIILPKKSTDDLEKEIYRICLEVLHYLETKQYNKLVDEIFAAYYDSFQQQDVHVLQQLNQMVDAFLYNKQMYDNSDLLLCLQTLSTEDIILKLRHIIEVILKNIDVYFFQIVK